MTLRGPRIRAPRRPEKVEQQQLCNLLRSIGAAVYVLGTRRPKRDSYHGTHQTAGIPDVFAILPASPVAGPDGCHSASCALWVEVKAAGGKLRPEQAVFRERCLSAELAHVVGGVDDVIVFLVAGGWLRADGVAHYRRPKDGAL